MLIKRGSRGPEVKSFQQFLIDQEILNDVADGIAGPKTAAAIKAFQKREGLAADGVAGRNTFKAAESHGWKLAREPIATAADSEIAAEAGIPVAVLQAFRLTESGGRSSAIRFEPHVFLRKRSDLAGAVPYTKSDRGYSMIRDETNRAAFEHAFTLDPVAAVESTSWGLYQVLGGFLISIYGTPEKGVAAFDNDSVTVSDRLVAAWFRANPRAQKAANALDWPELARRYNGPNYAVHSYDKKLAANYDKMLAFRRPR
jgi:hypothetical protein